MPVYADDFEAPNHDFAAGTSLEGRLTPVGNARWERVPLVNPYIIHNGEATVPDDGRDSGSYLTTPYASRIALTVTLARVTLMEIFLGAPERFGPVGYVLRSFVSGLILGDSFHGGGLEYASWEGEVAVGDTLALAWNGTQALVLHNGVVVISYGQGAAPAASAGIYYAE